MLLLNNVKKDYGTPGQEVHALRGVSLRFRANEFVSILGASGCGKTTLLNIIGGLDHYTSGDLVICGKSTKKYKDHDWDVYRNHRIGFVFQSYNLIPHQTVLGNVELALTIAGVSKAERRRRAIEALEKVGLGSELKKRPNQLSGGQMQRVAIARALVNNPEILLADEPTGALDTQTSVQIMELIREIAGERLVIMVTHNPEIAEQYSSRIVRLKDGLVIADSNPFPLDGKEKEPPVIAERFLPAHMQKKKQTPPQITCPYCGFGMDKEAVKTVEKGVCVCQRCARPFYMDEDKKSKTTKVAQKPVKPPKTEKKRGRKERSSMSYTTSLGLSARNLASKKGRTLITSFAGSIGIISVCLVLALSNGFNGYIMKTQEDMLSYYPVKITETAMDMTTIMARVQEADSMPDLEKIGDKVYVNSFLTNIAQGMTVTNDLSPEYLSYLESMPKEWREAIVYDTGMELSHNLFTEIYGEDGQVENVKSLSSLKDYYTQKLVEQEEKYAKLAPLVSLLGDVYGKLPGTADLTAEDYGTYVLSQYDVLGEGEFPQTANQAALVIGGNNDVIDLTLAQLGFISEEEFLGLFPEEGDKITDEEAEKYELKIDFDKVIGKKFTLFYNDAVFSPAADSTSPDAYLYEYEGTKDSLQADENTGMQVEITCILRLKKGLSYGCLGNGLYFTEALYEQYQEKNADSAIVQTLKKQVEVNDKLREYATELEGLKEGSDEYRQKLMQMMQYLAANGKYFKRASSVLDKQYISADNSGMKGYVLYGDTAMRMLGGKSNPNDISIYTDSFEHKESILGHLNAWNESCTEKAKEVSYTDVLGTLMGMLSMILNAITYVLVAFTAISLVVSSVMIGIITYVSVVERTKEIGVLRSLGARKKDIKNLFNAETFIIGLTSGVFGVIISYGLCAIANVILGALTGISTLASLPIVSALVMIAISVILTLISGLIPAKAAANKDPVIALRSE